jgi:hypothetical protein
MVSIVSVVVSDDLDGSPEAEPVSFGLEGVTYEIDLSDKNRAKLQKELAPYIERSRRVTRAGRRTGASRQAARSNDNNMLIRAWARDEGLQVSERGRISADVIRQYDAAH